MAEQIKHSSRAHALLNASSAARWLACPPSAVAAAAYENTSSEYAAEGTRAHEVAEIVASGSVRPGTDGVGFAPDVTPEMLDCAAGYRDYIQEQIRTPDAVQMLERRVDFSAYVPDGFGTCDCIIIQGDTLTIIDYKYGKGVAVSAENNPQMRLYALGALNDYGIAYDVENVEMHIYQPRINNISTERLTVSALLEWAEKIVKPTAAKAAKGKGDYSPGAHCRFCPHARRCRALTRVCTEYVTTHGARTAVPVLAPHEVADVLQMEPLVTLWLKRVREQAMTTMLDGGEIPGYKVVEGRQGARRWTDEHQVAELLDTAGYTRDEYTTTTIFSPAGMDKALGKKKVEELLSSCVERSPGSPTIVPASDKRPPYDREAEAKKDFE